MKTPERIRHAWKTVPDARDACSSWKDYPFPKKLDDADGQGIACRVLGLIGRKELEKISGIPVEIKNGEMDADGKPAIKNFTHYNKKFFEWAVKNAVPAASDRAFKKATAQFYVDYFSTSAESFLRAIYALESQPKKFAEMRQKYVADMNAPGGIVGIENYLASLTSVMPEGSGHSLTLGFWLRRTIDGSAPALKSGLETLVKTYTPERLAALKKKSK
jgi:hypothetical protein